MLQSSVGNADGVRFVRDGSGGVVQGLDRLFAVGCLGWLPEA